MVSFKQWKAIPTILVLAGIVCIALVWAVLAGGRSQAQASTFTVNTTLDEQDAYTGDGICETAPGNGTCSLRAAVQESNSLPNADVIVLPAGVYTLTLAGILEDWSRYGDLDILGVLTLQGAGAEVTIIDGNQLDRVIDLSWSPVELEISGVTIRNGNVDFPAGLRDDLPRLAENGGCVRNLGALTLRDSVVAGCRAGRKGGGIYTEGVLDLQRIEVRSNQAGEAGGGIFVAAVAPVVTLTSTPFPLPTTWPSPTVTPTWTPFAFVTSTPTATPGALPVSSEQIEVSVGLTVSPVPATPTPRFTPVNPPPVAVGATIRDSVIEDNLAPHGGGVYNTDQLALDRVLLSHNWAVDSTAPLCCSDGGGLEPSGGGIYSEGRLTLSDSQVISNTASGQGGGLVNWLIAESYRSDFAGNRAGSDGGGIFNLKWLSLNDSMVRNNVAEDLGGGIANNDLGGYYSGTIYLEGSTVSGNTSHSKGGGIANGTPDFVNEYRLEQVWLTNSTVSDNVADGSGGGIYTGLGTYSRVFLNNTTITANVADADGDEEGDGGGIFNRLGEVQLRNSILAANQDHSQGTQRPDCWTPRRVLSLLLRGSKRITRSR